MRDRVTIYSIAKPPETIAVADKSLRLGGTIKHVPTMEFAAQQKMTDWIEGLVIDADDVKNLQTNLGHTPILKPKLFISDIKKYQSKFALFDNGITGLGVCATENIPANTVIALYGGKVIPVSDKHPYEQHGDAYACAVNRITKNGPSKEPVETVHAREIGNIARFFQHAPNNLDDYRFTDMDPSTVATANLVPTTFSYNGHPALCFITKREIEKGESLLWDYDKEYWMGLGLIPYLFNKNAEVIDPAYYTIKNQTLIVHINNLEHGDTQLKLSLDVAGRKSKAPLILEGGPYRAEISYEKLQAALEKQKNAYEINIYDAEISKIVTPSPSNGYMANNLFVSKKEMMCLHLNYLTEELLPKLRWSYMEKKETAILTGVETDRSTMEKLAEYLKANNLTVQFGNNPTTKQPTIYVKELKRVDQISNLDTASEKKMDIPRPGPGG